MLYRKYKHLSEGLFAPIKPQGTGPQLSPDGACSYRRLMVKFEKCAKLREKFAAHHAGEITCKDGHAAAIVAARTRASECRRILETLQIKQDQPCAPADPELRNTYDVLASDDGDDKTVRADDLTSPPEPCDDASGFGKREEKEDLPRRAAERPGPDGEDDDEIIECARRVAKLELLCDLRMELYRACDQYQLTFTNEIKYEMIHVLLLYIHSEADVRTARGDVRSFLMNKDFLVSLGFFCVNNIRNGKEGIMRKAAKIVQSQGPADVSTMNLKEMLIQVHYALAHLYK